MIKSTLRRLIKWKTGPVDTEPVFQVKEESNLN